MEPIFSILPFLIMAGFLFVIIETAYSKAFARSAFFKGIPVFKRTIALGNAPPFISLQQDIALTNGVAQPGAGNRIYLRTEDDRISFPAVVLIPVRVTGSITASGQLQLVGRIPVSVLTLFICFSTLPVMAMIREGFSPALLFLIALCFIFWYHYIKQKGKLENMMFELEQLLM